MKYEKLMEQNLANHFGEIEKISEVDAIVFEDDNILVAHFLEKDARSIRIQNGKNRGIRQKNLYLRYGEPSEYSDRTYMNRDDRVGVCPIVKNGEAVAFVKKGHKLQWEKVEQKVKNRKVRYQKFEEYADVIEIGDVPMTAGDDEKIAPLNVAVGDLCYSKLQKCQRVIVLNSMKDEIEGKMAEVRTKLAKLEDAYTAYVNEIDRAIANTR